MMEKIWFTYIEKEEDISNNEKETLNWNDSFCISKKVCSCIKNISSSLNITPSTENYN
jgi:hypothetical protein